MAFRDVLGEILQQCLQGGEGLFGVVQVPLALLGVVYRGFAESLGVLRQLLGRFFRALSPEAV